MKHIYLSLLFSLGVAAQNVPAPVAMPRLETLDGKVYVELTNVKLRAGRVNFRHSDGLASVKIERLSKELLEELSYDPVVAAEEARKLRANVAAHHAAVAKMEKDKKDKQAKKEASDRAGVMGAVELSRAVSDYTLYQEYYRIMAMEQRQRDLRNAADARYRTYGK